MGLVTYCFRFDDAKFRSYIIVYNYISIIHNCVCIVYNYVCSPALKCILIEVEVKLYSILPSCILLLPVYIYMVDVAARQASSAMF